MSSEIYLDNSLIARPSAKTLSQMLPFLSERWGSASAPHQKGQELYPAIEASYRAIYQLLGAKDTDTIILTSSGAEAVSQVVTSTYFDVTLKTGKNHFLTSNVDEAPAILSMNHLEHFDCVPKMIKANAQGIITADAVADAMSTRTALVSLSWANGLTGVIQPVAEIAKVCKERGVALHLDATHVLGKLYFDLAEVEATFISFNGDSLHAPKGTGGLYIKEGIKISPLIWGGMEQAGLRAGSLNVSGLVALAQASKECLETKDLMGTEVARLRYEFEHALQELIPEAVVFFQETERLPHVSCMGFPGVANEALLYLLNRKKVYASIGGGTFQQISMLLEACHVESSLAQSAISFSLSRETTEADIEAAVQIIADSVKHLRRFSPIH